MHTKRFLENEAVTVRVCNEFHRLGKIVPDLSFLKRLFSHHDLSVPSERGLILRSSNAGAWVPTELVSERVFIGLLCDRESAAVALILLDNLALGFCLVNHFHRAEYIDARIESALVQEN